MIVRAVIRILFVLPFVLFGLGRVHAQNASPPSTTVPEKALDLAIPQAVIELGPSLAPRQVADPADPAGAWFTIVVQNSTAVPLARVLTAVDSPAEALDLIPPAARPALTDAAASEQGVIVERTPALADHAVRVVLPPGRATTLALHFLSASGSPSVLAWSEPALVTHMREAALLAGVVSGLLAASMAFAAGAAVLSGRLYARWAAVFLGGVLFAELTSTGFFDNSILGRIGGPYALFALALALAVAAGIRLVDHVASFDALRPGTHVWRDGVALGIAVTGVAVLAAIPVAGLLVRLVALVGSAAAAGYLLHCGRLGIAGARRLAPAATIFALVAAAAACNALGLFGINLVASGAIGGFSAAGAMLVALSVAIPIEPAGERLRELSKVHAGDDTQASITDETLDRARDLAAIAASHQGVFDLDLETGVVSLSAEAAEIFDLPAGAGELSADSWLSRIFADDRAVYDRAMETYRCNPGVAFRLEFRTRSHGGRTGWMELRATMIGQSTEAERCLGLIADVTARKVVEAEQRLNGADALTGFGNRAALISHLEAMNDALGRATLALFDLDRFKQVNESLGQTGGDALLSAFAERLERGFVVEHRAGRAGFFRVGGDMFAVFCADATDLSAFGERIVAIASPPFPMGDRDIYLPTSVGVASGASAQDAGELIAQAELAMVEAKRQGGDRVCVYSSTLSKLKADPVALEADLRRALERDEIELHYQPIVYLKDGRVAGFEALLRWRHPTQGLVEPDSFIPHAERSGLIVALGRFALKQATGDLARWQHAFPKTPSLFVSVNIAWRQIAEKGFAKELEGLLKTAQIAKHSLKLELTESAVMAGAKKAEMALKRLKALGAGLAIDDFGTGHSSLSHLRRFPFDVVKIDKSFLAAADEKAGAAILASIVALAHELELAVVAEGIEKEADAARLNAMGCEFGQGFLFGQPLPDTEIDAYIAANTGSEPV